MQYTHQSVRDYVAAKKRGDRAKAAGWTFHEIEDEARKRVGR